MSDLSDLQAYIDEDNASRGPMSLNDEEFGRFARGEPLADPEEMALALKAQRDARELEALKQYSIDEMRKKGYRPETRDWASVAEPAAEPVVAPLPEFEWVRGPDGQPVQVTVFEGERWNEWVQNESAVGRMSDEAFSKLLAARQLNKTLVYGAEPLDPVDIDQAYLKLSGKG